MYIYTQYIRMQVCAHVYTRTCNPPGDKQRRWKVVDAKTNPTLYPILRKVDSELIHTHIYVYIIDIFTCIYVCTYIHTHVQQANPQRTSRGSRKCAADAPTPPHSHAAPHNA